MTNWRIRLLVVVIASLCATCGGSGGGSTSTFAPSYTPPPPSYPDVRGQFSGNLVTSAVYSTGDSPNWGSFWVLTFNQTGNQLTGTGQGQDLDTGQSSAFTLTGSITTSGNLLIYFSSGAFDPRCTTTSGSRTYTGSFVSNTLTLSNSRTDLCNIGSGLMISMVRTSTSSMQKS